MGEFYRKVLGNIRVILCIKYSNNCKRPNTNNITQLRVVSTPSVRFYKFYKPPFCSSIV